MHPNTLDELLEHLPSLKRLRSLDAKMLRIMLGRESKQCTWCGKSVPQRCRLWCSTACVDAFRSRCDSAYQTQLVTKRDAGICQICSRDTIASEKQYMAENRYMRISKDIVADRDKYGLERGRFREVDHINPVVESGGLCGPDGLRLVCGHCHAIETAKLAGKRSGGGKAVPVWMHDACRQDGCEGDAVDVRRIYKDKYTLTCQLCNHERIVSRRGIDECLIRSQENHGR